MKNSLRFITLSKYPPYRSGHAKQALWNNTALAVLTGVEQHQVTYCGASRIRRTTQAGVNVITSGKCPEIAGYRTGIYYARSGRALSRVP